MSVARGQERDQACGTGTTLLLVTKLSKPRTCRRLDDGKDGNVENAGLDSGMSTWPVEEPLLATCIEGMILTILAAENLQWSLGDFHCATTQYDSKAAGQHIRIPRTSARAGLLCAGCGKIHPDTRFMESVPREYQ